MVKYLTTLNKKRTSPLTPNGYTGREMDAEDLYYYRARYYDPNNQRFLSLDPIGFEAGDFNFYRYVGNDPVNFVDPSGLKKTYFCTGGGNFTAMIGGEIAIGSYWTDDRRGGGLVTLGFTTGFDASIDITCGEIAGEPEDLSGWFNTGSMGIGPLGGSLLFNDKGKKIGNAWSGSLGCPVSAKSSINYTWLGDSIPMTQDIDYTNPINILY